MFISHLPLTWMVLRASSLNGSLNRCRMESVTWMRPAIQIVNDQDFAVKNFGCTYHENSGILFSLGGIFHCKFQRHIQHRNELVNFDRLG